MESRLSNDLYTLDGTAHPDKAKVLNETLTHLKAFSEHFLGFPGNQKRGYDEDMK
jgi:hypothetical protein